MLDRSIPFYNTILKCEQYVEREITLPEGYHFRTYRAGDERAWARLEHETGDFETQELAEAYFAAQYCQNKDALGERCVFVLDREDQIVGSCIAWHDAKGGETVASLHWLVVSPAHQGRGLGRALCQKVMEIFVKNQELPVYIHTQPWSYAAILLYVRLGFKLQKKDTFSHYENQYRQSMETLKPLLTGQQYGELAANSE